MPPRKKLASIRNDQYHSNNSDIHLSPEAIIAEEMNRLTIVERESISDDIHGVRKDIDEKGWYIDVRLREMEAEIKKLTKDNHAYNKALFFNRAYVKDRSFELMFLRTDCYDPVKAAWRLVLHFQKKLELFGAEKLTKHITWNDLDEESTEHLRRGSGFCFASRKDRSGRALFVGFYAVKLHNPTSLCHARAGWYSIMSCLVRDEETQRKGMTGLFFAHGSTGQDYMDCVSVQTANRWFTKVLPFRFSAVHLCTQNDILRSLQSVAVYMAPASVRTRIRVHCGSLMECMYNLNTFGVEANMLPFTATGERDLAVWKEELALLEEDDARRFQTATSDDGSDRIVTIVRDADVLLGKGYPYQNHPGTRAMMNIVETLFPIHDVATRPQKAAISSQVVEEIKQLDGRFLQKKDDSSWIEVDDSLAHAKAAMGFRNLKRRQSKL